MGIARLESHPVTFDSLGPLPESLDGSAGINRASTPRQIVHGKNDWEAIQVWLREFDDSPQTYRNYKKEAERLLLWAIRQRGKPLSSFLREDFMDYECFLSDPQPSEYWCGPRAARYSEQWKPFKGPLSKASRTQAMIVINALLSYLVDAGYLQGNPLSLIRRRNSKLRPNANQAISQERFLDQETWTHLKAHIDAMPKRTEGQRARYHRVLFLFHMLYLLAPRLSEVANSPMNSFQQIRGHWWWTVTGKGGKAAKVPVGDDMLDALKRYRQFLDSQEAQRCIREKREHEAAPDLPDKYDTSPLIRSIDGQRPISANMIYRIVKAATSGAADELQEKDPYKAERLRSASTHWMRHTSVTHADDAGIELKYLKNSARHEKFETTAIYQHAEELKWHVEWQRLRY